MQPGYERGGRGEERAWVQITPVVSGSTTLGTVVTFSDVARFKQLQESLEKTNHELETAYAELQATSEELETTSKELQSTNEELETMNEELQSTNEQMETMTDEFRVRSEELAHSNSFLESVLSSFDSGVAVIDRDFRITAWNQQDAELWGLREDEVLGEHLLGLDIGLPVEELTKSIRTCLESGERQSLMVAATNRRGSAIDCQVTCTPLRDTVGEVTGVILLMSSVTPTGR